LQSLEYIYWIAIGFAMHGVYKIFFPYLVFLGKTNILGVSTTVAAIANIILNYLLINKYGTVGAAYATIASYSMSAMLVFAYQYKHCPMPWFNRHVKQ